MNERVAVDGGFLEAESQGAGEPVLLIHGSIFADSLLPLAREPVFADRFRVINYHRRGFAGSSRAIPPFSLAQQAADAVDVLRHFGVARAHVVGHSYGGATALQLALDAPQVVHTLGLLEPAVLVGGKPGAFAEGLDELAAMFEAGEKSAALDAFGQAALGPGYRDELNRVLPPGFFELAIADGATFFRVEVPALQAWTIGTEEAGRLTQPALSVLGTESDELFGQGHAALQKWLPNVEPFVVAGVAHGLQMSKPSIVASGLTAFFGKHPM